MLTTLLVLAILNLILSVVSLALVIPIGISLVKLMDRIEEERNGPPILSSPDNQSGLVDLNSTVKD